MIRELLQKPDPRLYEVANNAIPPEVDFRALIQDLKDTKKKFGGYALAAPQIGVPVRVIAGADGLTPPVLVSPIITRRGRDIEKGYEGCLSIAYGKTSFEVTRHRIITVAYLDEEFKSREFVAKGLAARIMQHEIDHLDGKLIG